MERFSCRTMVVSGADALSVLGEGGYKRLLVVAHPRFLQSPPVRQLTKAANDPEILFFSAPDPEPTMYRAVEGSRRIRSFQPDLVAALGDGGVTDLGKAMVCFSRHQCTLAAAPMPFGWGSEVTGCVRLRHNGRDHLLQDQKMYPDIAILDSSLTAPADRDEVKDSGFSLLAAALEAYAGGKGGFLGLTHARDAFVSGWAALPAAFAGKDGACLRMGMASVLAGMAAEQTGLGLCSAMCSSLGILFGLSRGKAAAILLPAIIGCNAHAAGRRYAELSRAAGLGGSREDLGIRNLKTGLIRLRRELGLPGTLVQAGVDIRRIWNSGKEIVELTLEDPQCRNNPVTVDDFVVRRILEEITGRI